MRTLLALAVLLALAPVAAAQDDSETPVSSDNVAAVSGPAVDGIEAFEGDVADVPLETAIEGAEVYQDLIELPPLRPYYEVEDAQITTILGPDNRVPVTPTVGFPARAFVLITMSGGRCSGFLYGKNVVATAGHCVHTGGQNGTWSTNVRVFPGRDGAASPFGSCGARRLYSVLGWTRDGDKNHDYGVIKLDCDIGNRVGWLGTYWTTGNLVGTRSIINGYPGDKPLTQWQSTDQIRVAQPLKLFYLNDTTPGMSGSAVYHLHPTYGNAAMGIHTNGTHNGPPWNTHNAATRITKERFDNLMAWSSAP